MTLNESVIYVLGPVSNRAASVSIYEYVIYNGSCLFHFTYSRAGRVTWIWVILHIVCAEFSLHLEFEWMRKCVWMDGAWQPSFDDLCTKCYVFSTSLSLSIKYHSFFSTICLIHWLLSTALSNINVSLLCMSYVVWNWMFNEEVMFCVRIDSSKVKSIKNWHVLFRKC